MPFTRFELRSQAPRGQVYWMLWAPLFLFLALGFRSLLMDGCTKGAFAGMPIVEDNASQALASGTGAFAVGTRALYDLQDANLRPPMPSLRLLPATKVPVPFTAPLPPLGMITVHGGQDTTLEVWTPNTNWGADAHLRVRQGNIASALVRFEAIPLPPSAQISKATLRLFVVSQSNWRRLSLMVYRVHRPWDEASATWWQASDVEPWAVGGCDGVPDDREGAPLAQALLPGRDQSFEIDITEAVRAWVAAPESNQGLLLKGEGKAPVEYVLASFEHGLTDRRPCLIIHYTLPTSTPGPTATGLPTPSVTQVPSETPPPTSTLLPTETVTAGPTPSNLPTPTASISPSKTATPTPSLTPTETPTPGPSPTLMAGSVILRTGTDTTLHAWFPENNYGNEARLTLRQGNVASVLLRFAPISLPSAAVVNSAELRLYVTSQSNVHALNLAAYRLQRSWDELSADWHRASSGQQWSVAGCNGVPADREGAALGRVVVPSAGNWLEMDVTSAVRQWVAAPEKNHGLLLKGEGSVSVESRLASFEYRDPAFRPVLIIHYGLPYPGPSPIPTGMIVPTKVPTPEGTGTPRPRPSIAWTLMIYAAGDNNLSEYLKNDLRLLENLPANPNVEILVLVDLANNYSWRYEVQPGGNYTFGVNKWFLGEVNTGDPATLSDFIAWGRQNYPAEHYCLAIIDHGRGTAGIARDETDGYDILTAAELRAALRDATQDGAWKIDVLHYYACLMGLFEQAYEVEDYADYWVACQNIGWLIPLYERYLSAHQVGANTTPREVAVGIAETYHRDPLLAEALRDISVLDLRRIGTVSQALDALAGALSANMGRVRPLIPAVRNATQKLDSRDYFRISNYDEYLDLYDLVLRLQEHLPDSALVAVTKELLDALEDFIVVSYHDDGRGGVVGPSEQSLAQVHGISIFFPPDGTTWDYNHYVAHRLFRFTRENTWDDFLAALYGTKRPPQAPIEVEWPPMLRP